MLKFIFFTLFLIPLSYFNNWWLVQVGMMLLMFMFYFSFISFYYYCNLSYFIGCDVVSYLLILLSIFICSLMIMASESVYRYMYYSELFMFFIILLFLFLFFSFSSNSLFLFYIFFESSLIPTLFLIFGWGYQPERLQAGMYFLFYTLFSSLPMLVCIIYFYSFFGSLTFSLWLYFDYYYFIFYLCMIFSFLVKIPMFIIHVWLPSAHVEAPVSGSMILAGVLLKLGGYGLFRVFSLLIMSGLMYNFIWISISMLGGIFISLFCVRQSDIKSLIAYSSVIHMGLVLGGIMTFNYWGIFGAMILMVAHGLCSSGLFCLANIVYERLGSRSLYIIKGLINFMPSMSLWWFMLSSYNMAAPPSLNLMGEVMLFNSLVSWNLFNTFIFLFVSFFSAVYTLYMYSYSQHGMIYSGSFSFSVGYLREYMLLFFHWFPLNLIIFFVNMLFI
uniref:NADH-ubiquinone oxidoreductase chain 4 n=1 Tax=Megacrania alpheus adan TaxID=590997 RepID=E2RV56_9NEOP|nr:NADH dehydrogenase subunit 4 [Megacrania alpheus adan]BAJ24590.1 NADH dehydrogenase subunit 4 [Megacrania alpheus adan]